MVIFDPSEDEGVIIFKMIAVNVPIMEIAESGIKNGGEEFPCRPFSCRWPVVSVVIVRRLPCIVEHHGVDERECSG